MAHDERGRDTDAPAGSSNGPNARPLHESIDQAAGGEPDDSSMAVEITPEEERRIADKILDR